MYEEHLSDNGHTMFVVVQYTHFKHTALSSKCCAGIVLDLLNYNILMRIPDSMFTSLQICMHVIFSI